MIGLMWYDDNPSRNLAEKVRQAARQYKHKFNILPNTCYVHPSEFSTDPSGEVIAAQMLVGGVEVIPSPMTLRHHFLIGREEVSDDHVDSVIGKTQTVAPTTEAERSV